MKFYRSILFSASWLLASLAGAEDASSPWLLRLALPPRLAEEWAAPRLVLPPPVELALADWEETEERNFFPHASLVRLDRPGHEVKARDLLRRELFRIRGSFSVGVDSRGGWETSLELHRNLTPSLQLGIGVSIGRRRGWGRWED